MVYNQIKTSPEGLSEKEAQDRLEKYGKNELIEQKKNTKLQLLIAQFNNGITYILIMAALISLLVGKNVNFYVILAVILINGLIGFIQEAKADAALSALQNMTNPETNVIRNCTNGGECIEFRIDTRQVVPGDLILLEAGDKVPADARLIELNNFEVDESMLTGESLPVRKILTTLPSNSPLADRKNLVYSGTLVTSGRARAIVFATGMDTEMGKISNLINETQETESPLQKQIGKLSKNLGFLAVVMSLITFLIGLLRGFELLEMLLFGIATLVSSIPSGLPASITITLAVGVQRMAKRHAIIRKLASIDSLGGTTTIVTDKTGTLTTNQMTAKKIYTQGEIYTISGIGFEPEGHFSNLSNPSNKITHINQVPPLNSLLKTAILCNNSHLVEHILESQEINWEIRGDPTEGALLVAGAKLHLQKEGLNLDYPRIDEIPFDSTHKFMATFHRFSSRETNGDELQLHIKGAPEVILRKSNYVMQQHEQLIKLTDEKNQEIMHTYNNFASDGLRVLGFASMAVKETELEDIKTQLMDPNLTIDGLIFEGLIGMIDPPRKEVKAAIKLAINAGINIIMATGDHKLTAKAIGQEIGIVSPNSKLIEGNELDSLDDQELDVLIPHTSAFVRVSPEHKFRVVNSLRRQNEIVAMTGDGANDAPALKTADVGVAMGITGTDVSKETASMVLTDDNFASIVNAIEEGRVVADNIKKGLKFLLTTNIGEILTILLSIIIFQESSPLFTALAILWVNLVTDGSLTVALAQEPKELDVMRSPPKPPNEKLLTKDILYEILFTAVIMAVGVLLISLLHGRDAPIIEKQTLAFNALAFFQIINALNCRSRDQSLFKLGLFSNRSISIGLLISITLQIIAVQTSIMNQVLGTTPLKWLDWVIIIMGALILLMAEEFRKFFVRKRKMES